MISVFEKVYVNILVWKTSFTYVIVPDSLLLPTVYRTYRQHRRQLTPNKSSIKLVDYKPLAYELDCCVDNNTMNLSNFKIGLRECHTAAAISITVCHWNHCHYYAETDAILVQSVTISLFSSSPFLWQYIVIIGVIIIIIIIGIECIITIARLLLSLPLSILMLLSLSFSLY